MAPTGVAENQAGASATPADSGTPCNTFGAGDVHLAADRLQSSLKRTCGTNRPSAASRRARRRRSVEQVLPGLRAAASRGNSSG